MTDNNALAQELEAIARIIDPSSWAVMDAEKARMLRKYKGQNIGYDPDQFRHKESMAKAQAILALRNPAPAPVGGDVVGATGAFTRPNDPDDEVWKEWTQQTPPASDEVRELVERLRSLGNPNQGMNYTGADYGTRKYDPDTGKPYYAAGRSAQLTVYGERALFLKSLIDGKGRKLADMLERLASQPLADSSTKEICK